MSKKIFFTTFSAFIIAFSIFFTLLFFTQYKTGDDGHLIVSNSDTYSMEKKFYSKNFNPNEKKIFLFGSSHVMPLNTTIIHDYLYDVNQNYTVYNLAIGSDHPIERLDTIDMIISAKPKIVVYGIADRDFVSFNPVTNSFHNKPSGILPDPHEFFSEIFSKLMNPLQLNLDFLQSPKIVTLRSIQNILSSHQSQEETLQSINYPNSPFFSIKKADTVTASEDYLVNLLISMNQVQFNQIASQFRDIPVPDKNENFIALKEIITKLHQNNIRVIVFTTPQNKLYLNAMPELYRKSFDAIVDNLKNDPDVKFYSLFDKYENLNIWHDLNHVAINNNATIYCDDVAKMIDEEMHP